MESAKLVNLIEVIKIVGDGTKENPTRQVIQYWTLKGKLLFTIDDKSEMSIIKIDPDSVFLQGKMVVNNKA